MKIEYEKNLIKQALFNDFVRSEAFTVLKDPNMFEYKNHQILWTVLLKLVREKVFVTRDSVSDMLVKTKNEALIPYLEKTLNTKYEDENGWQYHMTCIFESYRNRKLIEQAVNINRNVEDKPFTELVQEIIQGLEELQDNQIKMVEADEAALEAFENIKQRAKGQVRKMIVTGFTQIDHKFPLDFNRVLMISAAKKIGKTSFIMQLIYNMLTMNDNIAVQVYSLETTAADLVNLLVSMLTGLTNDMLLSRNYKLTHDNGIVIEQAIERIKQLSMEIVDKKVSIYDVKAKFKAFKRRNPDKDCVLVIDNHGMLVQTHMDPLKNDEIITQQCIEIRNETKGLIIVLHHLTKEQGKEDRIKFGYMPKQDHVRGNTRIVDYTNILWLLHRPNFYDDLMAMLKNEVSETDYKLIENLFLVSCELNRNGATGLAQLKHEIQFNRFFNY